MHEQGCVHPRSRQRETHRVHQLCVVGQVSELDIAKRHMSPLSLLTIALCSRAFPKRQTDRCEQNSGFCTSWSTAGFASELAIGCGALTLLTLIVGVSTHSRRRRIWRVVAGLIILHSVFPFILPTSSSLTTLQQVPSRLSPSLSSPILSIETDTPLSIVQSSVRVVPMAVVMESRTNSNAGVSYALTVVSWALGVINAVAVMVTGHFAERGHRWAAGNRAYRTIQ